MHFKTFINGVAVGVILGILFAPDSGEETRRKISRRAAGLKDQYDDLADNVSDTYSKAKSKAQSLVGKAKDDYVDIKDDVTEDYYDAKDNA